MSEDYICAYCLHGIEACRCNGALKDAISDLKRDLETKDDYIEDLEKAVDARQALLERVFGKDCGECSCAERPDANGPWCTLLDYVWIPPVGRLQKCPFLPFEKGEGK